MTASANDDHSFNAKLSAIEWTRSAAMWDPAVGLPRASSRVSSTTVLIASSRETSSGNTQLRAFLRLDPVDHIFRNVEASDDLIVEDAHAAGRNSAHCQFFVAGDTELANDKDIERHAESAGYFDPVAPGEAKNGS